MNIFSSVAKLHLESHKDLENAKILRVLEDTKVERILMPAVGPNGADMNVLVKAGDPVLVGTRLAVRKDMYVPVYSPVSGTVKGIEMIYHPGLSRPANHIVILNDGKNTVLPGALKTIDPATATKEDIVAAIKEAGIIGMGGAGFPTFIKYQGVKNIDYVLLNGAECEPYLTTDYLSMQLYAREMIQGALLLKKACDAKEVVIAFKVHKNAVKEALEACLSCFPGVRYVEVPDVYPMGWEKALIKTVFDRTYEKLPAEAGVIVNNVQTAVEVYRSLVEGKVMTHRLVCINGDGVNQAGNVLVPMGTSAKEIIDFMGGYAQEEVILLPGGPMTAKAAEEDGFSIQPAIGGLTILKSKIFPEDPCLRCGNCTMHCPAFLQPVEIMDALERKDEARLNKLNTMKCVECGLCATVCPSKIDVSENMKRAKRYLKFAQAKAAAKK